MDITSPMEKQLKSHVKKNQENPKQSIKTWMEMRLM